MGTEVFVTRPDAEIFARLDGENSPDAPTVVFANSLGTSLSLWDQVVERLPKGLRIIRYDMRGHGKSSLPPPPYSMGALISDAEAVCEHFNVREALFVGLSVGGMVAQGLAIKRLDLIRAIVLSNTAAKIGTPDLWSSRIEAVEQDGLASLVDATMMRWFSKGFYDSGKHKPWQDHFLETPDNGYVGICHAISGTDFMTPTSGLRLPALGIAGSEDGATPPDLVRETMDLIPGSQFDLIKRAGHLPCVDHPDAYAEILTRFMTEIGHN